MEFQWVAWLLIENFFQHFNAEYYHLRHTSLPEKFVRGEPETGDYLAEDLERIAGHIGGENIAACIVEPVAGSTGTLVPPKDI